MKFSGLLSALTFATAASATTVSYDTGYDNKARSMTAVSCSDGANGMMTRYGWKTQGDAPKGIYVGGNHAIAGWNSPSCGLCYRLEYKGKKIHVIGIDHAGSGFNIGLDALNALTNGQAVKLGRVDAKVFKTDVKNCGLRK
ncbi:hypothetical protein ACJ41O_005294 [Fusarium nematophilum]